MKISKTFSDSYTSSLDVDTLGDAVVEVAMSEFKGLLNIGCTEAYSKSDLVIALTDKFKIQKKLNSVR